MLSLGSEWSAQNVPQLTRFETYIHEVNSIMDTKVMLGYSCRESQYVKAASFEAVA